MSTLTQKDVEHVFGSKFKIDGRITYITQWLYALNMPVSQIVYVP